MHSHKFGYFIIGTNLGHLSVWKLAAKRTMIHQYEKHVRAISCITQHPEEPNLFLATALDGLMSIYSLDQFTKYYNFSVETTDLLQCKFVSFSKYFCVY